MAGAAAGGFVARAFESMLKECGNKKYSALQSTIKTYMDNEKDFNLQPNLGENNSSSDFDSGAEKVKIGGDNLTGNSSSTEDLDPTLQRMSSIESVVVASAGDTLGGPEVELVLNPLRLAFETKNVKVVDLALDCLHKLIEYNQLEGDPGLDGGKNSKLLTDILNIVCSCVGNSTPDSTTLQVLKVLLTAIASTKMRVHGEPLLEVIRVCSNIALNSKTPVNQVTSKSMLRQMLSIIFRHVETNGVSSDAPESREASSEDVSNTIVDNGPSCEQIAPRMSLDNLLSVKQINKTFLASVEGVQNLVGGTDIKRLEDILEKAVRLDDSRKITSAMGLQTMNATLCDALIVFHTLCEMAVKEGNNELTTKTRLLVLDLLQGSLEDVEESFKKNLPFIDSIRAHLSYALLRASLSQSPSLIQCAIGILSVLLVRFRESFKAEIGIFFPMIALRSLDGPDLTQKLTVLRMIEKISKDPQMLVDLYINYDCDPDTPNLFERMVVALSKISQVIQNMDPKFSAASHVGSIKTSSLQGLVNALKSLVIWEKSGSHTRNKNMEPSFEQVSPEKFNETKSSEDRPWNFEKDDAHESITEAVISEFNRNSVKGIHYLMSCQLVENTPPSVAQFLRSTPYLNKAMIGNYLGKHEEFATSVMHAYVESMNFSGMKFHIAIHEFLQGFRLPEESQKIDRILEKFAERYFADNPGLFKNADTAYVLAYAILMLVADGDNVIVPHRMSRSDFIHLSKRYNGENSVPDEILEEIYDAIKKQEINVKADPSVTSEDNKEIEVDRLMNILNLSIPKRRSLNDVKSESEAFIKQIEIIMKDQNGKMGVFYTSRRIELIYSMVETLGWPILATFAVTMGEADSDPRIGLCMEGFKEGIHLTHVLGMDTMRYAFLTSLLRYNFLHAPRDMREKNVEALRTLLDLCDTDVNTLQDSWLAILECISRLEYVVSWPPMTATIMQGSNQVARDSILQSLRELSGKPTEQVFMNSIKLPSESVVEFFTALCSVSAEELKQTPPRTFSLRKVVEISYDNMARIHMVWARIWSVLSLHFIYAGEHADEKVAMYAIDALRQLGMKYLERIELANFSFQNDILKPFAILMQRSSTETLRRLLLNSIVQIIKSKAGKLKSGWGSIFMIFTAAADDDLELIVERAFENVEQVILEHFDQIFMDCFMDCMSCLIGFAKNKQSDGISLKAISLLRICEHRVAEGLVSGGSPKPADTSAGENLPVAERYWYAMLGGLSDLTSDPRSEVRNCALDVLFDLLNERGSKFSYSFWETIFQQVLFPIFDHIRSGKETSVSSGNEWLRESSVHALQLLCNLYNCFYKDVSFMLPQLLGLLLECGKKIDQSVASLSLGALVHLIEVGGHQFCDPDWDTLLQSIRDASYTTQPLELLNGLGFENRKYHQASSSDFGSHSPVSGERSNSLNTNVEGYALDPNQVAPKHADVAGSDGMPSPSGGSVRPTDHESLQHSQSLGQRIMGNMKENLLVRTFTSKPKKLKTDEVMPSSPPKLSDATMGPDTREEESPVLGTIRSKCITQLLLLGAIDLIQKKYWNKLNAQQKITLMEILFSAIEFAASYNSNTNLRLRMHQLPTERAPINLLRQELTGTCIYLDILQKTTATVQEQSVKEENLEGVAVEKFVSFCEQFLRDASDFQSSMEGISNMEIHRVLELRSPVIVKVLKSMCIMNPHIFKTHLNAFYPSITKLICCDLMEVRCALADLFSMQFPILLQWDFRTVS